MRETGMDVKMVNRVRAARFLLDKKTASRQELAAELGVSMPTVFQLVKDLTDRGILEEAGEYGSTGGRKAKILALRKGKYCVAGVEISRYGLQMVLVDLAGDLLFDKRVDLPFENAQSYDIRFSEEILRFLDAAGAKDRGLLGVGVTLPGTLNGDILRQSLTLGVKNMHLSRLSSRLPCPVSFGNNARSAALAEVTDQKQNMVYLSLGDTVGGGAYLNGVSYGGDRNRSALFGHMIVVPQGRQCYCGKRGCLNAYCSVQTLSGDSGRTLEEFFTALEAGDSACAALWDEYLSKLALAVANLRTIFDCQIILGGAVSRYLRDWMDALAEKVLGNIIFEQDLSFVKLGRYGREAFAMGAARLMLENSLESSDLLRDRESIL